MPEGAGWHRRRTDDQQVQCSMRGTPLLKGRAEITPENRTWLMFNRRRPYMLELIHWEEKRNK